MIACTPTRRRQRQEPASAVAGRQAASRYERGGVEREQCIPKGVKSRPDGRVTRLGLGGQEKRLQASPLFRLPHQVEEKRDVASSREAVDEPVESPGIARRIECGDEARGTSSEDREQSRQTRADRCDAPVGQSRREQRDDLAILGIVEAPDDTDRIGVQEPPVVQAAQLLEGGLQLCGLDRRARHPQDTNAAGAPRGARSAQNQSPGHRDAAARRLQTTTRPPRTRGRHRAPRFIPRPRPRRELGAN
jgi:hypothetical protein